MMHILRLAAAVALAADPAASVDEECQARQVLIQQTAELWIEAPNAPEGIPRNLSPRATRVRRENAGKFQKSWLESNSIEDASVGGGDSQAKVSHSSARGATGMDRFLSDIQYAVAAGGHSGNEPMWLRLHIAAGIIVVIAASMVMICRPPHSPPAAAEQEAEHDDAVRPAPDAAREVESSESSESEDLPQAVPSLLTWVERHDEQAKWRWRNSESMSTMATERWRSSAAPSNASTTSISDRAHSPLVPPAPESLDDSDSGAYGSASNSYTEEVSSLLIGDSAAEEESGDDENAAERVSDTFEASGHYLSPVSTAGDTRTGS